MCMRLPRVTVEASLLHASPPVTFDFLHDAKSHLTICQMDWKCQNHSYYSQYVRTCLTHAGENLTPTELRQSLRSAVNGLSQHGQLWFLIMQWNACCSYGSSKLVCNGIDVIPSKFVRKLGWGSNTAGMYSALYTCFLLLMLRQNIIIYTFVRNTMEDNWVVKCLFVIN